VEDKADHECGSCHGAILPRHLAGDTCIFAVDTRWYCVLLPLGILLEKLFFMRLNLALNGILIASAPLDPARYTDKYYMKAMRRILCLQNQDILDLIPARPVYYIEVPAAAAATLFMDNEKKQEPRFTPEGPGNGLNGYTVCTNLGKNASFSRN
jgi:hypothetical protein